MRENNLLPPPIIETPTNPGITPTLPKPKFKFSPLFFIIIFSLFFVTSISAAYYFGYYTQKPTPITLVPTQVLPSPTTLPTLVPEQDTDNFGTLVWNSSPQKIPNPTILNSATTPDFMGYTFADLGTFTVGKFSKGASLVLTFINPEGPSSPIPIRFIVDNNKYYLIETLINDDYTKKNLDKIFNTTKVKFISYQIKDLYYDNYYNSSQGNYSVTNNAFSPPKFISSLKDFKIATTTSAGDILVTEEPVYNLSDISNRNYYLKLHDFSLVTYKKDSVVYSTDNQVPIFNFLDNSPNKSQFTPMRIGCGGGTNSTVILNSSLLNSKTLIGKNGLTEIFQIKNIDSPLVKYLYGQYKESRDYPSAPSFLSIDKFAEAPNHIIFQEKTGEWTLLINPDYATQAECGKPVIYLYPPKDTQISVKVGANITKSEPLYPENGWIVFAHPNGQLDYQNQIYPSLFWEGIGYGIYNSHPGEGIVVSQKDLISTLNFQLTQQGLNTQESADFMDFWAEKLPTTPFIRLTWLNTKDMDILAPLAVSPAPNTKIRIFLDFEGLQEPVTLVPQKLSAPQRRGFTLVEWGGLLVK